jgi:tRNA (guanine-N7-)-methyltransferase
MSPFLLSLLIVASFYKLVMNYTAVNVVFRLNRSSLIGFGKTPSFHRYLSVEKGNNCDNERAKRKNIYKVRQHTNPLSHSNIQPLNLKKDWYKQAFGYELNPLLIDIGCAKGIWTSEFAKMNPDKNVLGLELRSAMAEFCMERKSLLNIQNLFYLKANANVHLPLILSQLKLSKIPIHMLTIQFPDPHFKKRHKKRRVVTSNFISEISPLLEVGTFLYVQSDVKEVSDEMVEIIQNSHYFDCFPGYTIQDLAANASPFSIQTEREKDTIKKGQNVYRMLFVRTNDTSHTT